jgi:hypothetical protein
MRGLPDNNFPAFDRAKEKAYLAGFKTVQSPADMDRADDENIMKVLDEYERQTVYAIRDLDAIMRSTSIAMIPGWETSVGARAEYFLAIWLGKEILNAETFEPLGEVEVTIIVKNRELQNV